MTDKLLPCPFCGGEPRLDQRQTQSLWNSNDAIFSHVSCDECDIHGQDFCDDPSGAEATEWWNRRAQPAEQSAPGEVEDFEVVAWLDDDGLRSATSSRRVMLEWVNNGYSFKPLMTVAQHQRIVAQLAARDAGEVRVPVELLERTIDRLQHGHEHQKALRELRALLAQRERGGE